jgi:hypothetical protein
VVEAADGFAIIDILRIIRELDAETIGRRIPRVLARFGAVDLGEREEIKICLLTLGRC